MSVAMNPDRIKSTILSLQRRLRNAQVEQGKLEDDIAEIQDECNRFTGHYYSGGFNRCEYCNQQKD